ncbi:hypothetical protein SNE40_013593 [Patella caerulea]|uniref:Uncharacterized protein n=1 Tax=Patella caerulea TaxID=87958 RepID=A0AAN8JGF8_PATCE
MRVTKQITNKNISTIGGELQSSTEILVSDIAYIDWSSASIADTVPVLAFDKDAIVTSGSVLDVRDALDSGSDFHITFAMYSLNSQYTFLDNSKIIVPLVSNLGKNIIQFLLPSFWYSAIISSDGNCKALRWYRISHGFKPGSNSCNMRWSWHIDSGWNFAYSHDSFGRRINGSKSYLTAAVRNGKPIKVRIGNTISRLHDVRLTNDEVSGITVDIFNLTLWDAHRLQIIRSRASTNGMVNSCTYMSESDLYIWGFSGREDIVWYVESRRWTKIVTLDPFDGITWGAVEDLYSAATSWKSLKIVIKHLDSSYQAIDVHNIHLMNSSLIILDTTTLGAVQLVADKLVCQQWAGFMYSDGMYETVKWTPGRTIIEERTVVHTCLRTFSVRYD